LSRDGGGNGDERYEQEAKAWLRAHERLREYG
jgi:hypothetical protein